MCDEGFRARIEDFRGHAREGTALASPMGPYGAIRNRGLRRSCKRHSRKVSRALDGGLARGVHLRAGAAEALVGDKGFDPGLFPTGCRLRGEKKARFDNEPRR